MEFPLRIPLSRNVYMTAGIVERAENLESEPFNVDKMSTYGRRIIIEMSKFHAQPQIAPTVV
jgi:hypothetical protein